MENQLPQVLSENERLKNDLAKMRIVLNSQMRRTNELELMFERQGFIDNNRSLSSEAEEIDEPNAQAENAEAENAEGENAEEENAEEENAGIENAMAENATAGASAQPNEYQVQKLQHQVVLLMAEVDTLRRKNDELRGEGAVGGCSVTVSPNPTSAGNSKSASCYLSGCGDFDTSAYAKLSRQSRLKQVSKDLVQFATTAENHLRDLMNGVVNLRHLAAEIEFSESRADMFDLNMDESSDYFDDCDEIQEFKGRY